MALPEPPPPSTWIRGHTGRRTPSAADSRQRRREPETGQDATKGAHRGSGKGVAVGIHADDGVNRLG